MVFLSTRWRSDPLFSWVSVDEGVNEWKARINMPGEGVHLKKDGVDCVGLGSESWWSLCERKGFTTWKKKHLHKRIDVLNCFKPQTHELDFHGSVRSVLEFNVAPLSVTRFLKTNRPVHCHKYGVIQVIKHHLQTRDNVGRLLFCDFLWNLMTTWATFPFSFWMLRSKMWRDDGSWKTLNCRDEHVRSFLHIQSD